MPKPEFSAGLPRLPGSTAIHDLRRVITGFPTSLAQPEGVRHHSRPHTKGKAMANGFSHLRLLAALRRTYGAFQPCAAEMCSCGNLQRSTPWCAAALATMDVWSSPIPTRVCSAWRPHAPPSSPISASRSASAPPWRASLVFLTYFMDGSHRKLQRPAAQDCHRSSWPTARRLLEKGILSAHEPEAQHIRPQPHRRDGGPHLEASIPC